MPRLYDNSDVTHQQPCCCCWYRPSLLKWPVQHQHKYSTLYTLPQAMSQVCTDGGAWPQFRCLLVTKEVRNDQPGWPMLTEQPKCFHSPQVQNRRTAKCIQRCNSSRALPIESGSKNQCPVLPKCSKVIRVSFLAHDISLSPPLSLSHQA